MGWTILPSTFDPFSYSCRFGIQEAAILGVRVRFLVFFVKESCFSVFLLNSNEYKDSRFIKAERFHLMVFVSFLTRIQFEGEVVSCL